MRRRLVGVADISISHSQQTAVVTFLPGTQMFSAAAFREAVAEADVEVVSLHADVSASSMGRTLCACHRTPGRRYYRFAVAMPS